MLQKDYILLVDFCERTIDEEKKQKKIHLASLAWIAKPDYDDKMMEQSMGEYFAYKHLKKEIDSFHKDIYSEVGRINTPKNKETLKLMLATVHTLDEYIEALLKANCNRYDHKMVERYQAQAAIDFKIASEKIEQSKKELFDKKLPLLKGYFE